MNFDADLLACAAIVEKGDPERFAAAMASPFAARRILFPLYAFNVEVSRAPWVTQEPMIAEMRLQWWRDALEEIAQGKPARRHEVVTPLAGILDREGAQILDRLVAARRWDIYKEPFEDAAHFERYLAETAAGLMWVAARALDADCPDTGAETLVRPLGQATGLSRFLKAVPALESQKRIPLVDGRPAAVAELARQAIDRMPARRVIRKRLGAKACPAVTEAFQSRAILSQIAAQPERVADGRIEINPALRSLGLWLWS